MLHFLRIARQLFVENFKYDESICYEYDYNYDEFAAMLKLKGRWVLKI